MGELIELSEHRARRAARAATRATAFFFDVCCPLSYLAAERIERLVGAVEWVAVDGDALRAGAAGAAGPVAEPVAEPVLRARAEARAALLRLPLVWPETYPLRAPRARRACAFACALGVGPGFALAASRLAFCGGFDLDDPETLAEAAAAAGLPLKPCLAAAGEAWRDRQLSDVAAILRDRGLVQLPALRVDGSWLQGEAGVPAGLPAGPRAALPAGLPAGRPGRDLHGARRRS